MQLKFRTQRHEKIFRSKRRDIEEWKSLMWGQGEGGRISDFCRTPSPSYPTGAPSSPLFFGAKILNKFFLASSSLLFIRSGSSHSQLFQLYLTGHSNIQTPDSIRVWSMHPERKRADKAGCLTKTGANKTRDELSTKSRSEIVSQKIQVYFWARLR